MKAWREFGSSHSANVTLIGEFETPQEADAAFAILEDFTMAAWEVRYPDLAGFLEAWAGREPSVPYAGLNQADFEMGVDNTPIIRKEGRSIVLEKLRSTNVSGLVKLLFLKNMKQVKITGHGP